MPQVHASKCDLSTPSPPHHHPHIPAAHHPKFLATTTPTMHPPHLSHSKNVSQHTPHRSSPCQNVSATHPCYILITTYILLIAFGYLHASDFIRKCFAKQYFTHPMPYNVHVLMMVCRLPDMTILIHLQTQMLIRSAPVSSSIAWMIASAILSQALLDVPPLSMTDARRTAITPSYTLA